jgi:hypothetical protein
MDENFRSNLMAEEEIDTIFDEQEAKYLKKIAEAEKREQLERKLKEDEQKLRRSMSIKMAKYMKDKGAAMEEISAETGLSIKEIEKIK